MFRVEGGALVFHAGSSIEKIYTHKLPDTKVSKWQKAMTEFDQAQKEMKDFYDKTVKEAH